ncbi:MAG: hypothetical protein UU70_C0003G0004 [Candidatus Yanofskybacteria bacterium GW2011_GWA1_41_6]|uniref:Uncharacterized protein n=1 Tax=Candidatus Yanofskybacteria bacterium GW2011_GWA1_41_6 TaxID=1619020 RepID=A0A0G0ZLT8_9BACT|nr:MAG: hypothetical protein UU70_C0003G0004 [Candidatus Yanofskybacteria bacterium GW2011_GWA1_41_6]
MTNQVLLSEPEQRLIKNLVDGAACFYPEFCVPTKHLAAAIKEVQSFAPFTALEIFLVGEANHRLPTREKISSDGEKAIIIELLKDLAEIGDFRLPPLARLTAKDIIDLARFLTLGTSATPPSSRLSINSLGPLSFKGQPDEPREGEISMSSIPANEEESGAFDFLKYCIGYNRDVKDEIKRRRQIILSFAGKDYSLQRGVMPSIMGSLEKNGFSVSASCVYNDMATYRQALKYLDCNDPEEQARMVGLSKGNKPGMDGIFYLGAGLIADWSRLGVERPDTSPQDNGRKPRAVSKKLVSKEGASVVVETRLTKGGPTTTLSKKIAILEKEIEQLDEKKRQLDILKQAKAICDQDE